MKTFESCNRVWLPMPEDGKKPIGVIFVRILTDGEKAHRYPYGEDIYHVAHIPLDHSWSGWYPVHQDGTDDQETAKLFATGPLFTPRPPRPRIIRRRFKLST